MDTLKSRAIAWVLGHAILFGVFSTVTYRQNAGYLFPGGDGGYVLHNVMRQHEWSPLSLGVSANPLQALGDIAFPMNAQMLPAFEIPSIVLGRDRVPTEQYKIFAFVMFSLELFLSIVLVARALKVDWVAAVSAAWLVALLALPYSGIPVFYPLLLFAPQAATLMAGWLVLFVLVLKLGQGEESGRPPVWRTAAIVALIVLVTGYLSLIAPVGNVLWAAVAVLVVPALIVGAQDRRERLVKIAGLAVTGGVLLVSGFVFYLYGLFKYTATSFYASQFDNDRMSMYYVSVWSKPWGERLIYAAMGGAVVLAALGGRRVRWTVIGVAVAGFALFGFGLLTLKWDFYHGPSPVYFETFLWPFYAIFACALVTTPFVSAGRTVAKRWPRVGANLAVRIACAIVAIAVSLVIPYRARAAFHEPPNPLRFSIDTFPEAEPPIVAALKSWIAIRPGGPFRGRVATFEALGKPGPIHWGDLSSLDNARIVAVGNDYHWEGLWGAGIPTLVQYNALASPAFYLATTRLLGRPGDVPNRNNISVLRHADARVLAIFGVRFVIADAELPPPFILKMADKTTDSETLRLYEVPGANVGDVSPVALRVAATFDAALDALADPAFDARHTAIVFQPIGDAAALTPARVDGVQMLKGSISVTAHSAGKSLIVLPFEFSRCRRLTVRAGLSSAARVIRVDALLTGILFDRDLAAELSYETSPFVRPMCRIDDSSDFSRLIQR